MALEKIGDVSEVLVTEYGYFILCYAQDLTAGGVDFDKPLLLGYTGMSDVLLQKYIRDSAFLWADHLVDLPQTIVGSVVGTHAGPGAVAVAFFKADAKK
jgi:hypothetical protein